MRSSRKAFRRLPDPRADNARHDLLEVLFIALAATLCGAESCSDMADFGQSKEELLRRFFAWSMASRATIRSAGCSVCSSRRLRARISPLHGSLCQGQWPQAYRGRGGRRQGPARRLRTRRKATPLHLVNVFAVDARMALAQQKAPGRNETAGALEVLELLSWKAASLPPMRCIASRVCGGGARARRRLCSGDQGQPRTLVHRGYPTVCAIGQAQHSRADRPSTHDRREARRATIMRNTSLAGLTAFQVSPRWGASPRADACGSARRCAVVRHYLLSKYISPKRLLHVTRSHWGIENQLHWVLDVHFAEDANRARKDHAPENLAILRRLALNILRTHPDRASLRRKIKRAGWDDAFLMATLSHMR